MDQQDKTPVAPMQGATRSVQEFYFPVGSGTDPDLNIPAEHERQGSIFCRWLRALPLFGR